VFNSGDTVTLGMTVFKDSNNKNAIIYMAKTSSFCMVSPALEFTNPEQGVIDGTTIGGYFQIVNAPTIPTNSGEGVFENIHIGASDQDFDGVADSDDTCPNTPPCTLVDSHGCPCSCSPPPNYPNLGCASQFTVFAMNSPSATQTAQLGNTTITGDVAASSGVTVKLMAPSTINGNVYIAPGATFNQSGHVNGTVFTNQSQLAQCRQDAINASAQAAALPPNFTSTNITTNTTITGVSGLNVVNVTGDINLGGSNNLTLSGPADAFFVVNVGNKIALGGSAAIVAGGAMPSSHLLINMTGNGNNLLNTHIGNTIQGTLLGSRVGGTLNGAFGSVILGQNFNMAGGVLSHFDGCVCQ
jgi:hypothetical protein